MVWMKSWMGQRLDRELAFVPQCQDFQDMQPTGEAEDGPADAKPVGGGDELTFKWGSFSPWKFLDANQTLLASHRENSQLRLVHPAKDSSPTTSISWLRF